MAEQLKIQSHVWQRFMRPEFALAYHISESIAARQWMEPHLFTNVRQSNELLVACDYAGFHKEVDYEAFAFLIGAIDGSTEWMTRRIAIRSQIFPDSRRMAYKSLGDSVRAQALPPFLNAANAFPGNLIVFLINKEIRTLFADPGTPGFLPELVVAERGWKHKPFQKLLLVASLGSLLLAGLSAPEQDILWVSDQDEIAPNPKKHDHAGHVIHHCIGRYAPDNHGLLAFMTTEADLGSRMLEDIVSVPDLAAGALVDAISRSNRNRHNDHRFGISISNELPEKTRMVLDWLTAGPFSLRRLIVMLNPSDDGINVEVLVPVASSSGLYLPNGSKRSLFHMLN